MTLKDPPVLKYKLNEFCYYMTTNRIDPIAYASITRVERIRDMNSSVRHEFLAVYASLGDTRMVIRVERGRSDDSHSWVSRSLTWDAFDTVPILFKAVRSHADRAIRALPTRL